MDADGDGPASHKLPDVDSTMAAEVSTAEEDALAAAR